MSSNNIEQSKGKSLLKQMREDRYAAEAQKNYEFSMEARQNYEHGRSVREKLTGNAQKGTSEVFSTSKGLKLQKQPSPNRNHSYHEAKENYAAQNSPQYHQSYDQPNYYEDDYSTAQSERNGGTISCHDKYEAMLQSASQKRLQEKLSPRPTSFY